MCVCLQNAIQNSQIIIFLQQLILSILSLQTAPELWGNFKMSAHIHPGEVRSQAKKEKTKHMWLTSSGNILTNMFFHYFFVCLLTIC